MSEDHIAEVDALLADTLPDDVDEISQETVADQRQQEMIELLKNAEEQLGRSPSVQAFESLEFETSAHSIKRAFGTWNDAKRAAGLETYEKSEGRREHTQINEVYFKEIDTPEKAYWLGTLVAASSITDDALRLGRVNKSFFVEKFSEAVESEYSIRESQRGNKKKQCMTTIFNSTFVDHLKSAGHPDGNNNSAEIPDIKERFRAPFTRGYLESSGYFHTGWRIPMDTKVDAERLQGWFESFGAKRPTIGETNGKPTVRVVNAFDIKSVFETCWSEGISTEPSYPPYPRKILDQLNSEYPYPENVEYLED